VLERITAFLYGVACYLADLGIKGQNVLPLCGGMDPSITRISLRSDNLAVRRAK